MQSTANCAKWPNTHFHGDNTGSNPVGDANRINYLAIYRVISAEQFGEHLSAPLRRSWQHRRSDHLYNLVLRCTFGGHLCLGIDIHRDSSRPVSQ